MGNRLRRWKIDWEDRLERQIEKIGWEDEKD